MFSKSELTKLTGKYEIFTNSDVERVAALICFQNEPKFFSFCKIESEFLKKDLFMEMIDNG